VLEFVELYLHVYCTLAYGRLPRRVTFSLMTYFVSTTNGVSPPQRKGLFCSGGTESTVQRTHSTEIG